MYKFVQFQMQCSTCSLQFHCTYALRYGGWCGVVVKAHSTQAGGLDAIPGDGRNKTVVGPLYQTG